jgi:hypothetical protein
MTLITNISLWIVPLLRLWLLLVATTFAPFVTFGYDGHDQTNVACSTGCELTVGYDAVPIHIMGEKECRTTANHALFFKVAESVAAKTEATVFRQGTFADEALGWEGNYVKGQQWATDNPLTTPNYAQKYGLPAENTGKPDWIVGGRTQGPYTTRPAPRSHNNPLNTGGATEVLPQNPNKVILDWFHMLD